MVEFSGVGQNFHKLEGTAVKVLKTTRQYTFLFIF